MRDLNDLYFFVQAVDHAGFAPAARSLGMPKSRLSRRIAMLEERLGVRLVQRTTRRFSVTEVGQECYRHCVAMLVEADAADDAIAQLHSEPRGLVKVSCPSALVCFAIGPIIARYMAANPRVTVELEATSRRVDVIGEGIDVAIRVRFPPFEDSDLAMRVLGDSPQHIVGSPNLVAALSSPINPADLNVLPSLGLGPLNREHIWQLSGPNDAKVRIPYKPRLVTDDMSQLLHAAIEGVGVAQLPDIVADSALASGALVNLLPEWTPAAGTVQAIFPTRRGLLPSVRSLIDLLAKEFGAATVAARPLRT